MVENQVVLEFFRSLDRKGTGRIGCEEFRSVCSKYLGEETTAAITEDLSDANGEISLKDLLQYAPSDEDIVDVPLTPKQRIVERRKSEARIAWRQLIDEMDAPALKQMMNTRFVLSGLL